MTYEIVGGSLPVLKLRLQPGEIVQCESGGMSWMDDEIVMKTEAGGIGKMFSRMVSHESVFLNTYEAMREGEIAFASKFPGNIVAVNLAETGDLIIQKGAFLASAGNVESEIFFQQRLGSGFFGGEGFIMRRYHGNGWVFLEVDGSAHEYMIPAGDRKIVNTGNLVAMSGTCTMEVQMVKGIKNVVFGGEGLFNTVVNGPGKITLQSMPIASTAMMLYGYMPHPSNH